MKIAVIGAGISGISIAKMLSEKYNVTVYEKDNRPGGIIKCDLIDGALFHRTGGHVFNSKREDVLSWFWNFFDKDTEFIKALRNSTIHFNEDTEIPYPIENYAYKLGTPVMKKIISELLEIYKNDYTEYNNFEDFLCKRFGKTLYEIYFKPYNYKVWRRDLSKVPLSWLEGKLPMPSVDEIIYNNIYHIEEREFVHSSFFYPKQDGSQFIIDRLSKGLNIKYNSEIKTITKNLNKWKINDEGFDKIIFCGNIKSAPELFCELEFMNAYKKEIENLEYHGTTTVFCEIEKNKYSWIYLPNTQYESHRIICTGNFSPNNNNGKMTATIEFTDYISRKDIISNLNKMPYNPRYITHNYEKFTYPIQTSNTRDLICKLKKDLECHGIFLLGRFAEWEYYNMDVAIGAALDLYNSKFQKI